MFFFYFSWSCRYLPSERNGVNEDRCIRRIIFHLYLRMTFDFHIDDAIFVGKVKSQEGVALLNDDLWMLTYWNTTATGTLRSGNLFTYPPAANPTPKLHAVIYIVIILVNISPARVHYVNLSHVMTLFNGMHDNNSTVKWHNIIYCSDNNNISIISIAYYILLQLYI